MPRIFVTRELPGERFAALRHDSDFELDIWPGDFPPGRDDLLEHVRGVDGLVCLITDRIDEAVLEAAGPQLKVGVADGPSGVDNVDLAACAARGIPVGNTPGVLTETTADPRARADPRLRSPRRRSRRVRQPRRLEDLGAPQ